MCVTPICVSFVDASLSCLVKGGLFLPSCLWAAVCLIDVFSSPQDVYLFTVFKYGSNSMPLMVQRFRNLIFKEFLDLLVQNTHACFNDSDSCQATASQMKVSYFYQQ